MHWTLQVLRDLIRHDSMVAAGGLLRMPEVFGLIPESAGALRVRRAWDEFVRVRLPSSVGAALVLAEAVAEREAAREVSEGGVRRERADPRLEETTERLRAAASGDLKRGIGDNHRARNSRRHHRRHCRWHRGNRRARRIESRGVVRDESERSIAVHMHEPRGKACDRVQKRNCVGRVRGPQCSAALADEFTHAARHSIRRRTIKANPTAQGRRV